MKSILTSLAGASIATIALATAAPALAQSDAPAASDDNIETAQEIVVKGTIAYRNRSEGAEPELVYDQDFFQRFEPLTAGDALKRVPSVTFLSDVIESDGARLRGLDPGYTQILINGEKVPGSNADRSFFLDRIPAELVKQVEIVRSSSARRTGDAVAGTLNIVLRDGYQLDGGYIRGGALYFDDGKVKPSLGAVLGTKLGAGRLLLGANLQGRYNPKKKYSIRFANAENGAGDPTNVPEFDNREDQSDVRNGTDYSFNANYTIDGETTDFDLSAFWVHTDRVETERSFEYDKETGSRGSVRNGSGGNLLSDNANVNSILQYNYSLAGKLKHEWAAGETSLKVNFAKFIDGQYETENEIDFDRSTPRLTQDLTVTRIVDREFSAGLDHEVKAGSDIDVVFGAFYQKKTRDTLIRDNRPGGTRLRTPLPTSLHTGYSQFSANPDSFVVPYNALVAITGGFSEIKEERKDAFALVEGKSGAIKWEVGLRYETTDIAIRNLAPGGLSSNTDYQHLLPSASAKIELGDGRITVSGARTVRRPRFDYISPVTLFGEVGDNDLRGNPQLAPEKAWGADLGYEHRLGRTGVIGVNVFYRAIKDLVELANTDLAGSNGAGTFILTPRNIRDGKVYGIEFDVSTSLSFLGLPDTGVFGNFSLLDSNVRDEFGERRFNGQSNYVYNVGFIQDVPSFGAAFGATYRKQASAYDRIVSEEVTTTYGADLEIFVEKRFGKSFTIRAVGSNLLDSAKAEVFNKFNTIGEQNSRTFDEYELESETAGPVFQIMARLAF